MKYLLSMFLLATFYSLPALSQTDTTFLYFNKSWNECNKDTAYYIGKVYKKDDVWQRKNFWVSDNQLQLEGAYLEKECKTPQGMLKWYNQNGGLKVTANYVSGKKSTVDFYYPDGKKKGHIDYLPGGTEQKGWTENGEEIPGYIAEREAGFPGGLVGWRTYLLKHLDAAAAAGAKPGIYPVKVQFIVDKEGNVSNVEAVDVPEGCTPFGKEAIRIIKKGPKWQPAIQDNQPVLYKATQQVIFQAAAN